MMLRSSIRRAFAVLASVALALAFVAGSAPAHAASVTINDNNCSSFNWDSSSSTLTCVTGSTSGPPSCSISGPSSVSSGSAFTLTLSCSGSPTNYAWTAGGFAQGATTAAVSGSITANTTFTATAANGNGTSAPVSKTVTVSTSGGGGGGGAISCAGFDATHVIDMSWSSPVRTPSAMGSNDAIVVRFPTGSSSSTLGSLSSIGAAEWGSASSWRIGTLSSQPCDFGQGISHQVDTPEITVYFTVGTAYKSYPLLQTNTTYYLNIMNETPSSCQSTGVCAMSALLVKKGVQ